MLLEVVGSGIAAGGSDVKIAGQAVAWVQHGARIHTNSPRQHDHATGEGRSERAAPGTPDELAAPAPGC
jgi:hypothetical protein